MYELYDSQSSHSLRNEYVIKCFYRLTTAKIQKLQIIGLFHQIPHTKDTLLSYNMIRNITKMSTL